MAVETSKELGKRTAKQVEDHNFLTVIGKMNLKEVKTESGISKQKVTTIPSIVLVTTLLQMLAVRYLTSKFTKNTHNSIAQNGFFAT